MGKNKLFVSQDGSDPTSGNEAGGKGGQLKNREGAFNPAKGMFEFNEKSKMNIKHFKGSKK